jgi:Tat protein secretion system quality control protein TatD with DNase activity
MSFERENRYLIFKRSDLKCLTDTEHDILGSIARKVRTHREIINGKIPLECLVIESDWPEFEPTWDLIEKRMLND